MWCTVRCLIQLVPDRSDRSLEADKLSRHVTHRAGVCVVCATIPYGCSGLLYQLEEMITGRWHIMARFLYRMYRCTSSVVATANENYPQTQPHNIMWLGLISIDIKRS
jgi:hypothetical protein